MPLRICHLMGRLGCCAGRKKGLLKMAKAPATKPELGQENKDPSRNLKTLPPRAPVDQWDPDKQESETPALGSSGPMGPRRAGSLTAHIHNSMFPVHHGFNFKQLYCWE